MSEKQESRADRVARYKEERRRQLAAQFGTHEDSPVASRTRNKDATSSSSEGPRPTRASKLRAAALSGQDPPSHTRGLKVTNSEKSPTSPLNGNESRSVGSRGVERDKSSKRKSNLNRSLTSEEVPPTDFSDDPKNRRRRRRFFPPEVLEQSKDSSDDKTRSDMTLTAAYTSQPSTSPITASSPTSRTTPKKSDLRVHMENARKGASPAFSEMGRYKPFAKRAVTSSPKEKPSSPRILNPPSFENMPSKLPTKEITRNREPLKVSSISDNDDNRSKNIAKRMEELTAFTRQTLARVERLANKNRESPKKELRRPLTSSPIKQIDRPSSRSNRKSPSLDKSAPSSILKKKSVEEPLPIIIEPVAPIPISSAGPVSILKRKVSQNDHSKLEDGLHSSTPPVTFSPSVVEPTSTKRKQGILKKRRSLDESTVMRHRSCSPDVANKIDARSILKNQRRSSLEELTRTQSPETPLQSILKRKTSRNEDDDHSLNSPQSILKRRSGASSASSTGSTPHVSITTAVILAAAGGAEMVLEPESEPVKPILKKKSFSEDYSFFSESSSETPKPILKKKSSTETDDSEEKPRPILKLPKSSMEREILDTGQEPRPSNFKHVDTECEVRPILKQSISREESPRPRLSFCGGRSSKNEETSRHKSSRRSHTICTDFNVASLQIETKEEDRLLRKPRPLSVHELVLSFEKTSTGAIPKKTSMKRNSDRYRTQPVTSNELEASLNLVKNPVFDEDDSYQSSLSHISRSLDIHSLLDFTSSLENDSHLNSIFTSTLHNSTSPESTVYGKMSSDSAFQSLGDGLELEQEDNVAQDVVQESVKTKGKLEPSKLELQMKAIAEEAKKMRLGKGNAGIERYRTRKTGTTERLPTRFSTQPVTFEEVQEASRINNAQDEDPDDDFEANKSSERKSILKTAVESSVRRVNLASIGAPKSVLKKRDANVSPSRRSILKTETSPDKDDEGISCNDSDSDSDASPHTQYESKEEERAKRVEDQEKVVTETGRYEKFNGDSTSEGESSGGREIKSIFKNDNRLRVMQTLENVLSKSKSQGAFGNETSESQPKKTVNIRRSHTQNEMPRTIADLRAKLQERGESEWRKRIPQSNNATDELKLLKEKNRYNDELSERSLLASKKDELDAASKQWKARVEKSDAEKFSVAGKMGEKIRDAVPTISTPTDNKKRTPQAKRFKLKEGSDSTPTSPEKNNKFDLIRSKSVPYSPVSDHDSSGSDSSTRASGRKVSVPKPDDFTFETFFKSIEQSTNVEPVDLSLEDFDAVQRQSLLVIKKNVQVQRRRGTTRNPIKALASRTDITNEYTEVITGVAEREKKRLNIEKLAKNSNKALEALAGLASNEDFKSVALKKSTGVTQLLPWKDLMLLQVKGRRHIQTRLVEPVASSINEGDNFILITPTVLYNYIGNYSNVIEQSRGSDIANHIQKSSDMGCKVEKIATINSKTGSTKQVEAFWKLLGAEEVPEVIEAGHPSEDETYESNILSTNMIYTLEGEELVPHEKYWGSIPKFEMLQETSILVFDFGSEMYVWSGKNAPFDKKRLTLKLAKEMWEDGFNYTECNICPLNIASKLGTREQQEELPLKADKRPDWALFAKVTQHRETVLFREKFLDWPDFSRVIRVKSIEETKEVSASYDIQPCDVKEMLKEKEKEPDVVIENIHLGRGDKYFDEETRRLFEYDTLEIKVWRILENTHEELKEKSIGQFYDGDSYIYSWKYRQTVKGRELNGKPSKHAQVGRDRCVFFCWHGNNSSINEKCTAAFLTVELDKQNAPQVRVVQGSEPAAFLRLFDGNMVIHTGKRGEVEDTQKTRLFIVRGEVENEIYLMEVPLSMSSLRSRSSFVIIDTEEEQITIWHGSKSSEQKRKVIKDTVHKVMKNKPVELYLDEFEEDLNVVEMDEGSESEDFFDIMSNNRDVYMSLLDSEDDYNHTLRLFRMSSVTGTFIATEILCPHRSEFSSPYPFVQSELYSASQPALFLIDNHHELWLWQGWWPEKEDEIDLSDQTGSGAVRWQAERKAAMQTAVNYWKSTHKEDEPVVAYLVWAGLEPLQFRNIFPTWVEKEDIAELNKKEGKKPGDMLPLEKELTLLSRTTYPLSELLHRPLPEGVDPTHIEKYLSPDDFQELLSMTKEEFDKLPSWKKTALKKEKGLF